MDPALLVPKRWDEHTTRDALVASCRVIADDVPPVSFEADELEPLLRPLAEQRRWKD